MKKTTRLLNILIAVAALFLFVYTTAFADLNSLTYSNAMLAYKQHNCSSALNLLKQYKREDVKFLSINPQILAEIDNAIAYCEADRNSQSSKNSGVTGNGGERKFHATGIPPHP